MLAGVSDEGTDRVFPRCFVFDGGLVADHDELVFRAGAGDVEAVVVPGELPAVFLGVDGTENDRFSLAALEAVNG